MCRNYFNQATMGKQIKKKQEKHKKYSRVRKSYSTIRKGIGGPKKKEKISKSETTTLTYFDNLKKKQQDQGSKNWCFISLTIPNLRTTAFYFENTKLLKQNNVCSHIKKMGKPKRAMAQWLRCWIPDPGVPASRPLGGSKVNSSFQG